MNCAIAASAKSVRLALPSSTSPAVTGGAGRGSPPAGRGHASWARAGRTSKPTATGRTRQNAKAAHALAVQIPEFILRLPPCRTRSLSGPAPAARKNRTGEEVSRQLQAVPVRGADGRCGPGGRPSPYPSVSPSLSRSVSVDGTRGTVSTGLSTAPPGRHSARRQSHARWLPYPSSMPSSGPGVAKPDRAVRSPPGRRHVAGRVPLRLRPGNLDLPDRRANGLRRRGLPHTVRESSLFIWSRRCPKESIP